MAAASIWHFIPSILNGSCRSVLLPSILCQLQEMLRRSGTIDLPTEDDHLPSPTFSERVLTVCS